MVDTGLITIAEPSDDEGEGGICWPIAWQLATGWLVVEYIGLGYDDRPDLTFHSTKTTCNDWEYVHDSCEGLDLAHLLGGEGNYPIASGVYFVILRFWQDNYTDWETGFSDADYGWDMLECKFLGSNLQVGTRTDPSGEVLYELVPLY